MMGDISEVERKDKAAQLRNIIVTTTATASGREQQHPTSYEDHMDEQQRREGGANYHPHSHHPHLCHNTQQPRLHLRHQPLSLDHLTNFHHQQQQHRHNIQDEEEVLLTAKLRKCEVLNTQASAPTVSISPPPPLGEHCPKHHPITGVESNGGRPEGGKRGSGTSAQSGAVNQQTSATAEGANSLFGTTSCSGELVGRGEGPSSAGKKSKKKDPKEIMKKRREKAICIDRVRKFKTMPLPSTSQILWLS